MASTRSFYAALACYCAKGFRQDSRHITPNTKRQASKQAQLVAEKIILRSECLTAVETRLTAPNLLAFCVIFEIFAI